ncbi:PREDICTED: centrosomal protein of 85 kDa-like [Amphimedon queenslandica]|uniref:Uncharacterized protein n=1 Tax=Amphimedon queenslandica TaxID=400682 RepID=A0A1X7VKG3_AMPQE|nr:PREDICTED: centrosomal protein of 85 kDa-like [Amphimedon queenslandica]|eukprot:XP_019848662.1 PREDICTED: centrosomal protein of 85 kDa-like [Amphimedon queenslandica]
MSSQEESASSLNKPTRHFPVPVTSKDVTTPDEETRSLQPPTTREQPQAVHESTPHKPPPTAKVAPLVGGSSSAAIITSQRSTTPHEGTSVVGTPRRKGNKLDVLSSSFSCVSLSPTRTGGGSERSSPVKELLHADRMRNLMSLLTEKSQIIEKQKNTITRLQQDCKKKDSQLRLLTLPQANEGNVGGEANVGLSAPVKLDILSRKLDEAYYELEKAKSESDVMRDKISDKDSHISQLETDADRYKAKIKLLEDKIVKLEGYLGNTPTMEEHYSMKEQVTELHSQNILLSERLREKEDKIMAQIDELRDKETMLREMSINIRDLKQDNSDLRLQCETSDRRLVELHSDISQYKIELMKSKQQITELEEKNRQDLRDMRERHKLRFQEATAKLKEQYKTVTKRNRQLELQLLKNSDVMTALNNELKLSQGTVADLKSSFGDLVKQNQILMEKNYGLQEPPEVGRSGIVSVSPVSDGSDESLQALSQEVSQCVEEVDSLVSLASSIFEGKEPDMSLLLGGGATGNGDHKTDSELDPARKYEQQLTQVQKNRKEIERLREKVTDHFASKVANECHLQ